MIICREIDKESGKIAVYPLRLQVDDRLLHNLRIRLSLNPELRYYATTKEVWAAEQDNITRQLKRKRAWGDSPWFAAI